MRARPDFPQIAAFLAVAEELNFRRAAERLRLDQSALSRRVRALEERLGFALLVRDTHSVQLTAAGDAFYASNRELVAALDASVERAASVARGTGGRLRVAYMTFAALDWAPQAARRFREARPDVDLELHYLPTLAQKLALSRGEVDLGLMLGPLDHPDFSTQILAEDPLLAFVAESDPLAKQAALNLADVARARAIVGRRAQWDFYRALIDEALALRGLALGVAFEAPDLVGILGLVRAGLGVALLPAALRALRPEGVVAREIADCDTKIVTLAAWPGPGSSAALAFVETLRDLDGARRLRSTADS